MIGLHNLKTYSRSKKNRKRIGRGNASGHGTYATRGMKGQRSRTGSRKGLIRKGLKQTLQRLPKNKGMKVHHSVFQVVNLRVLEKTFLDNAVVTPAIMLAKGLINSEARVKILGKGRLQKKLKVSATAFSKNAKTAIIKAGGQVTIVKK